MGPNQLKLIARRASVLMIPKGGNLGDGINAIVNHDKPGGLIDCTRQAQIFIEHALLAVKQAQQSHGDPIMSDEEICGEILKKLPKSPSEKLEERRQQLIKEGKI